MQKLPVYRTYQCAICHASAEPVSGDDLNSCGVDFERNRYEWNAVLAAKDSDGDKSSNGYELSDSNGDGTLDPGLTIERGNPGDAANTPSAVDRSTWGILKSLFED